MATEDATRKQLVELNIEAAQMIVAGILRLEIPLLSDVAMATMNEATVLGEQPKFDQANDMFIILSHLRSISEYCQFTKGFMCNKGRENLRPGFKELVALAQAATESESSNATTENENV